MKINIILWGIFFSLFIISNTINAQHKNDKMVLSQGSKQYVFTDSVKVSGNCEICKKKIETSAKQVEGVYAAVWNQKTKMLKLSYTGAPKRMEVQKSVARAGYDAEQVKASDQAYKSLPACCQYDRSK